jgi:cyclopropane fatty-acyl-phospholipid synthase-like methyltransferase
VRVPDSERVKSFYDGTADRVWSFSPSKDYHVGLFHSEDEPLAVAQTRTVMYMADRLEPTEDDVLLDVGCGTGNAALQIAQKFKCKIVGVNISEKQLAIGEQLLSNSPMKTCVKLLKADAHHLPFKQGVFTAGYALESLMHMNRKRVLHQVCHVLRPGSRFVLCDWIVKKPLTAAEERTVNRLTMGSYLNMDQYTALMEDCGFVDVAVDDWTKLVEPTYTHWTTVTEEMERDIPEDWLDKIKDACQRLSEIAVEKLGYVQVYGRRDRLA